MPPRIPRRSFAFGIALATGVLAILLGGCGGSRAPAHSGGSVVQAAEGALDTSFGKGGKVLTRDWGGSQDEDFANFAFANAVAIQSDGKIVVDGYLEGGHGQGGLALARYTTSGHLDLQVRALYGVDAAAVASQPDGKVLVAGEDSSWLAFSLARYTTSGKSDSSFGTHGKVLTRFGPSDQHGSSASALAVQPDGKIVVAGQMGNPECGSCGPHEFALARYTTTGTLDTSFGTGGTVLTDFGAWSGANAVAIEPDGKIVVAGSTRGQWALVRYTKNGTLDPSFGTGGKVLTHFGVGGGANAVAIQPDGKIVVAGSANYWALARYTTDGTLDTSFGAGGKVLTHFSVGGGARAVALEPGGKIVVVGGGAAYASALARYTTNGTLDTDFGTGGKVLTHFSASAIAIQPDGKIVVAGDRYGDFALARYLP